MKKSLSIKKRLIVSLTIASSLSSWAFTTASGFPWNQSDLWQTITSSYSILQSAPPAPVEKEVKAFLRDKAYIEQLSRNAQPYLYYVYQQTQQRHMPAEIALLPMVESDYYPFCMSNVGAEGLWQLMTPTAKDLKINMTWWLDGRRDVMASTQGSLNYLDDLQKHYKGNWPLTLAAYNAGQGTVDNAIKRNKAQHLPTDYWSLKLPKETEQYVPKLLAIAEIFKNANKYGIKLAPVANAPAFTALPLTHPVNLQLLANKIHMDSNTLLRLNPQFRRWVTPPRKSANLLVPNDKVALANAAINEMTAQDLWKNYTVASNNTSLSSIAKQFGMNTDTLQHVNHLASASIKPGQVLLVPVDYSNIGNAQHANSSRVVHTVAANETLSSIAKNYHTTETSLRAWNSIPATGVTKGETVVIWTASLALFDTHPRHMNNDALPAA